MIFVTVGTHTQQFNRLLEGLDELVGEGKIKEGIFAQTGHSDYRPRSYPYKNFLTEREYYEKFETCRMVISHGGAGSIITALGHKKPLIIAPRLKEFGEHTNNHQLDLARKLKAGEVCEYVSDVKDLGKIIKGYRISYLKRKNIRLLHEIEGFLREVEHVS